MTNMIRALWAYPAAIGRSLSRDRPALFLMLLLPVLIITIVGEVFGDNPIAIGVVNPTSGFAASQITSILEKYPMVHIDTYSNAAAADQAVRKSDVAAAVVFPKSQTPRRENKRETLTVIATPSNDQALAGVSFVESAADLVDAEIIGSGIAGGYSQRPALTYLPISISVARSLGSGVRSIVISGNAGALGRFAAAAPENLVLFVFTSALVGAVYVVRARQSGVLKRSLASPIRPSMVLAGLCSALFFVALVQSVLIIVIGSILFAMNWGNVWAVITLVIVMDLVGGSAGILVGSAAKNADLVGALAPIIGVIAGAIGGCIVPLELFPSTMQTVAHLVPQFWAVDAWQHLVFDGAGVAGILPDLMVLVAFAAVFAGLSVWYLRRDLRFTV